MVKGGSGDCLLLFSNTVRRRIGIALKKSWSPIQGVLTIEKIQNLIIIFENSWNKKTRSKMSLPKGTIKYTVGGGERNYNLLREPIKSTRYNTKGASFPAITMQARRGRRGIAPTHSWPWHYMGWVVGVTPWPRLALGERTTGTHCIEGWVGLRAGLDIESRGNIICFCRGLNPGRPSVQSCQTLHWLSYLSSYNMNRIWKINLGE
jgi:hypothetical protein